jgi:hypothetical protein
MPVAITCGSCGQHFRVGDEFAGQRVACPKCHSHQTAAGPTVPPFDAFVSYSSKDKAVADAAVAALEADGVRCWVAPRDIVPGTEWSEAIIQGINQSRLVVLVFSGSSNASQQVLREVERAVNRAMPIVPFRIENLLPSRGMEYFISASHWLDAYHPPLDDHLRTLSATAKTLLTGTATPRGEAPTDLRGRLRAATRSLIARDNRVRVLAGLAGLVFLIGLLAFASVYALRPGPAASAPADVVKAKADAEVLIEKVRGLDKSEGIGTRADEVENHFRTAQTLFADRKFDEAGEHFRAVSEQGTALVAADRERADVRPLRERANREFQAAQDARLSEVLPALWPDIAGRKASGDSAFQSGDFANARAAWDDSITRLGQAQSGQLDAVVTRKALAYLLGFSARRLWAAYKQEEVRNQHAAVTGAGAVLPPIGPGRRPPVGGKVQPAAPAAREDVSEWLVILRKECKPRLGLDPDLIDEVISEADNNVRNRLIVDRLPEVIRATLGLEAERAYLLGAHLSALVGYCELGTWVNPYAGETGMPLALPVDDVPPLFSNTVTMAYASGAPRAIIDEVEAVQKQFEARPLRYWEGDFSSRNDWERLGKRLFALHVKYTKSPADAARAFREVLGDTRTIPGQEEPIGRLRQRRAAMYFDDPKTPTAVTAVYLYVPITDTDALADDLRQLTGLRRLHLGFNPLTDAGLAKLTGLVELQLLGLSRSKVTDAGLEHLKGLTRLEKLYLNGLRVTDSGLEKLHGLSALRELEAFDTGVTQAGVDALKRAIPKVKVSPDESPARKDLDGPPSRSPKLKTPKK